LFFHKGTSI